MDGTTNTRRVAELISTHLDSLVSRTQSLAWAQVPWYRSLAPADLDQMFRRDYQELARVLATDDMVALRTYVEETGMARIEQGAPAAELITVATLLESGVSQLIANEMAVDAGHAAEATRRVQTVIKNIRMILSSINLRLLTQAPPPHPHTFC